MTHTQKEASGYGVWLKAAREAAGLTQVWLAQLSGVSSVCISYLETGHTKRPMRTTRKRIETVLRKQPGSQRKSLSDDSWMLLGRMSTSYEMHHPEELKKLRVLWNEFESVFG